MRGAFVAAVALVCLAPPARATHWVICDYDVRSTRIDRVAGQLTVRLLQGRPRNSDECPVPSGEMTFTPETADYQSELPRARWPKPGRNAFLRYRHLDGICKSSGPCRIHHHSIIRTP